MVFMMVAPGLVAIDLGCAVLRMAVCLPSADVTNFRMVPAGSAAFL